MCKEYLNENTDAFKCPTDKTWDFFSGYGGLHSYGYVYGLSSPGWSNAWTAEQKNSHKESQVKNPSELVLLGDSADSGQWEGLIYGADIHLANFGLADTLGRHMNVI